jgi:AcrR family transcriptional regulator
MSPKPAATTVSRRRPEREATRQRLEHLLAVTAALYAEKGYEATSMRDVSGAVGGSLAGLYHYCSGKEDLLYQLQYRTFATLLEVQTERARMVGTAEERFRRLVIGHLAFFVSHPNELKVCTYELESLQGEQYDTVEALRRKYHRLVSAVVGELMGEPSPAGRESRRSRHATLFIFGMLNWIFMWYDPARHGTVEEIGEEMLDLALRGLRRR